MGKGNNYKDCKRTQGESPVETREHALRIEIHGWRKENDWSSGSLGRTLRKEGRAGAEGGGVGSRRGRSARYP